MAAFFKKSWPWNEQWHRTSGTYWWGPALQGSRLFEYLYLVRLITCCELDEEEKLFPLFFMEFLGITLWGEADMTKRYIQERPTWLRGICGERNCWLSWKELSGLISWIYLIFESSFLLFTGFYFGVLFLFGSCVVYMFCRFSFS